MQERDAQELVRMVESAWRLELGQQGRDLWRRMLLPYDAELATKAVVLLTQRQRERPAIADLKAMILKLRADERRSLMLPKKEDEPPWVKSHRAAREAGDYRFFVEQIPGLAELDVEHNYDGVYAIPEEPVTDKEVWVQIGEYGYTGCAYDFAAPPGTNRLCAMHPYRETHQPLKLSVIGKHTFMLCLDCQARYLARYKGEEVEEEAFA